MTPVNVSEATGPPIPGRAPAGALNGLTASIYLGILKAREAPDYWERFSRWKQRYPETAGASG